MGRGPDLAHGHRFADSGVGGLSQRRRHLKFPVFGSLMPLVIHMAPWGHVTDGPHSNGWLSSN